MEQVGGQLKLIKTLLLMLAPRRANLAQTTPPKVSYDVKMGEKFFREKPIPATKQAARWRTSTVHIETVVGRAGVALKL